MDWETLFNVYNIQYSETLEISVFEVKELNSDTINYLDKHLVSICEGEFSYSDKELVKTRVKQLFAEKKIEWKMGAVAEFFTHLYIQLRGFKQECMFFNTEERSIKKGFDGYYNNGLQWIMESKSGSINTVNISHGKKIKEALVDLENKLSGGAKNNPWVEAYNHACHCDVGTPADIRKSIKKLSDEYTNKRFHNMNEFNIMPSATIFLDTTWDPKDKDEILAEVQLIINQYNYKKAHLICVTQNSVNIFMDYINI